MQQDKALSIARRYIKKLKENKLPIEKAYLFGSYARNQQNKYSDIDICLIVNNYRSDKVTRIWHNAMSLQDNENEIYIEPFIFTKNDFNKESPLPGTVMKEGIKIST